MKKWKIIRIITIIVPILFIIELLFDLILCINMKYPHDALGIDVYNWFDQFTIDFAFIIVTWIIPLLISLIFFIISTKKIKKNN